MTTYATQTDLERHYGTDALLVASDRNGVGEIDVTIVANALLDATSEIDSYLNERYDLPLVTVPTAIERTCCEIAFYRMSSDIGTLTDEKRRRYEDAIKWLTNIAKGVVGLGLEADDATALDLPETSSGDSESSPRLFTRSSMGSLR